MAIDGDHTEGPPRSLVGWEGLPGRRMPTTQRFILELDSRLTTTLYHCGTTAEGAAGDAVSAANPDDHARSLALTSRKAQPGARKPSSFQDFEGRPLKRPTENRERNQRGKTPGQPPAQWFRSRGRCAEPRQHWGKRAKKNQPITVGFWVNGGNSEYELTSISFNPARRFKLLHVIFCRCRHLPQGAQSPQVGGSETGPRVQACRPCFPRSDAG